MAMPVPVLGKEPQRTIRTWVVWGSLCGPLREIAEKAGVNAGRLLEWLEGASPAAGGRLQGQSIRWATFEERRCALEQRQQHALVEVVSPTGKSQLLPLAKAARRLRNPQNKPPSPAQLMRLLECGPWVSEGHMLRLCSPEPETNTFTEDPDMPDELPPQGLDQHQAPEPKPEPNPEPESEAVTMTTPEHGAAESEPSSRGGHKMSRPILCGDRVFSSQNEVARHLGMHQSRISKFLRRHPDGVEIAGQWVRYADTSEMEAPHMSAPLSSSSTPDDGDRQQQNPLDPAVLSLLRQTASSQGVDVNTLLLSVLPVDGPLATILDTVDRAQLAALDELGWQRLRAIARLASAS